MPEIPENPADEIDNDYVMEPPQQWLNDQNNINYIYLKL